MAPAQGRRRVRAPARQPRDHGRGDDLGRSPGGRTTSSRPAAKSAPITPSAPRSQAERKRAPPDLVPRARRQEGHPAAPSSSRASRRSPTHAPIGDEWVHEIKFDGYRLQARIDGGKVKLLTRKGLDWTAKFARLAEALKALKLGAALIDGEVVVEGAGGVSSFTGLQAGAQIGARRPDDLLRLRPALPRRLQARRRAA